eukprot:525330_1
MDKKQSKKSSTTKPIVNTPSSQSETEYATKCSKKSEQHLKIVSSYMAVNERLLSVEIISDIMLIVFIFYFDALLIDFEKTAALGQLFLKFTGKRRRKPQDRIVKVSFDKQNKPKQISWGSGPRHISWEDIQYIAWGHWTPVFDARKDQLNPELCFSVVGKQQILDVQAQSKQMTELWVKGLRMLLGQSDYTSDALAKAALETGDIPGSGKRPKTDNKIDKEKRAKSLLLLQQDLFVMTISTVFRNLEEERIWDIDEKVTERFNPKILYEQAVSEDIPWRQWNHWVRDKVVTYLKENGKVRKSEPVKQQNTYMQQQNTFVNNMSTQPTVSTQQEKLMNNNEDNCKQQ